MSKPLPASGVMPCPFWYCMSAPPATVAIIALRCHDRNVLSCDKRRFHDMIVLAVLEAVAFVREGIRCVSERRVCRAAPSGGRRVSAAADTALARERSSILPRNADSCDGVSVRGLNHTCGTPREVDHVWDPHTRKQGMLGAVQTTEYNLQYIIYGMPREREPERTLSSLSYVKSRDRG